MNYLTFYLEGAENVKWQNFTFQFTLIDAHKKFDLVTTDEEKMILSFFQLFLNEC